MCILLKSDLFFDVIFLKYKYIYSFLVKKGIICFRQPLRNHTTLIFYKGVKIIMNRIVKTMVLFLSVIALVFGMNSPVFAVEEEMIGVPIIVYGDNLSDGELAEVRELLEVDESEEAREYYVTGEDYFNYIGGSATSNMFSSAKIVVEEEGSGLTIHIVTPDDITKVTTDMYANALLTAGVENASVYVASPRPVTGHSALTGIYKAYDAEGAQLDQERMEVASEELDVATDLADKEGMTQEKVSELLAEIKKAISEQNPATKEDIEQIIKDQLDKLEIKLSDEDRQMLINLFDKMRNLDIDFDKVKGQLEELTSTLKDKMDELGLDEGFWEKAFAFLREFFSAIGDFFKGIFK